MKNLVKELERICGKGDVLYEKEELLCYSYDASPAQPSLPQAVVFPTSTEEVVKIMRLSSKNGLKVIPRGAGTGLSGATVPLEGDIVLCLTKMNKILEIDNQDLVAVVEPGVITGELHNAVEKMGLFYPPDPASASVCTIGGNIATCAGGLRAMKYGVTRDYVLGLEAVLPDGEVLNTGGRVIKEVSGYDLIRLLVGSEGTLAIFTKIILKLLPLPQAKRTILASYRTREEAALTVSAIISRLLPATLEFMDRITIRSVEAYSPAGLPADAEAVLLIEVDGTEMTVKEEGEEIERICRQYRAIEVKMAQTKEEAERLMKARRSVRPALLRLRPSVLLEDTTVPISRLVEMVSGITEIGERNKVLIGTMGHAGDGNLHPFLLFDDRDEEERRRVDKAVEEIVELAINLGGTVSGEHGIGLVKKRFLPLKIKPKEIEIMKGIKKVFDPQNILNPGKLFPDDLLC